MDAQTLAALDGLQDITIIATHPRYEYFARRYGLKMISLEWEAGAMPIDAEIAELSALVADTQATLLIWEAAPPNAALEITTERGLRNVVFSPLAHGVEGFAYVDAYKNAASEMSKPAEQ